MLRACKHNKCFLIDGLLYHREKHASSLTVIDRDHISLILQECYQCPYMGQMSEDKTKERVASTAWWLQLEQGCSEYINTCEILQKANINMEEIWATSTYRITQTPMGNHPHGLGQRTGPRRQGKLQ
ncbi:hypothetical protein O181_040546 [Austropuccinia psidii MF-1]|uniref:Integrase zinc-binding domain-containing protein n=1 Tax=Austropuccinia psidii MF-1 TaxID=1389203 RepID=A0A9Q3HDH3_9BASI|nr:hypothetical protein [Austropuccinia psidii MF-1]